MQRGAYEVAQCFTQRGAYEVAECFTQRGAYEVAECFTQTEKLSNPFAHRQEHQTVGTKLSACIFPLMHES